MDRAEAIEVLKNTAVNIKWDEKREEIYFTDKWVQAYEMAIAALREQEQSNEPLTLEELKKMEGKVWICYPQDVFGPIHPLADNISCTRYKFGFNSYGETWIAYRKPPKEGAEG